MMWVQISAGAAPIESCRFVYLFWNKIQQECSRQTIKVELVDSTPGSGRNTFKSVFLKLTGHRAKEFAYSIKGSMLWICKSEFRPNHKRNNWYLEVEVLDDDEPVEYSTQDIKIETMRCSGNGGQNVNKLETGVRVTHIPTGIVVSAQEERSQLQNRKLALLRLQKRLKELKINQEQQLDRNRWKKHQSVKRGEPVRTFRGKEFRELVRDLGTKT